MGLFDRKTKQEKELERELAYRKAKSALQNYIDKCKQLQNKYWEQGKASAKIGDAKLLRQFAIGYMSMQESVRKGERLLLYMEGIKLQRDKVKISAEFVEFAKDMSESVLEGINIKDVSQMQGELAKSLTEAEKVDFSLTTVLDALNEKILASPEDTVSEDVSEVSKAMEKEVAEKEKSLDGKIEEGLKKIEEAMKSAE